LPLAFLESAIFNTIIQKTFWSLLQIDVFSAGESAFFECRLRFYFSLDRILACVVVALHGTVQVIGTADLKIPDAKVLVQWN
jgi:hypothetical protein